MPHVNAHQMLIAAEGEFIDQKDKMTHSVNSQPPPPKNFCSLPMNEVAIVVEIGIMNGLNNMIFHSRMIWLQLLLSARYANRDQP